MSGNRPEQGVGFEAGKHSAHAGMHAVTPPEMRSQKHLSPEAVGPEVSPAATALHPIDNRAGLPHGLIEQLVHRTERGPHHVTECVHVLAALDWYAQQIRQYLVYKGPRDL